LRRTASITGINPTTNSSAAAIWMVRPNAPALVILVGLPSLAPPTRLAASAARVRSDISRRSFSAPKSPAMLRVEDVLTD
jgi:hypothetical protein